MSEIRVARRRYKGKPWLDKAEAFSWPGVHVGVALRFLVRLSQQPAGWRYQLVRFEVRSPTGQQDLIHWLPLGRLLDDPDFRPDVADFQRQLQQVLPDL